MNVDHKHIKDKISGAVRAYVKMHPEEYRTAIKGIKVQRSLQRDQFASLHGDGALQRALYEIPEKLNISIMQVLSAEELMEYKTNKTLPRWFAKTYKEFSLAETI